jgi:hypothetical protein
MTWTDQAIVEKFARRGIYELCTISDEPVAVHSTGEHCRGITYEAHGPGYKDDSSVPRDGLILSVKFILSPEEALNLWNDAWAEPRLLRDMTERYVQGSLLSESGKAPDGDWDRYGRPPYPEWDARPESFMAFRTSFDQAPGNVPSQHLAPL